jgi:hypothetical protein
MTIANVFNVLSIQTTRLLSIVALVAFSIGGTAPAAAEEVPPDPQAYQLMINAVNARAVWDEKFPGFTADVKINYEGRLHAGDVKVLPDGEVKLTNLGSGSGRAKAWARDWLGEMVFHRMGTQEPNDQYRGMRMVGGENDPLGPLLVKNDPLHSSFRVDGKVIRQVNRDLGTGQQGDDGPQHVRINVLDTTLTQTGKVLPTQYVINYLDDDANLIAIDAVSSRFSKLGRYELPKWRRVITTRDGNMFAAEMTLSNHRLLSQ